MHHARMHGFQSSLVISCCWQLLVDFSSLGMSIKQHIHSAKYLSTEGDS